MLLPQTQNARPAGVSGSRQNPVPGSAGVTIWAISSPFVLMDDACDGVSDNQRSVARTFDGTPSTAAVTCALYQQ